MTTEHINDVRTFSRAVSEPSCVSRGMIRRAQVKGCTTLIPPVEVLLLSENSVKEVCTAVWVACFTANPPEVAFDLLCRLMRCITVYLF